MPDRMPEDMSDRVPEDMPDRMAEDLPDRMPEDMPEDMPDHMPEDMPDRMPNRMSEDMSDRMPEDLPVRKCINVMVGITRSKVIFLRTMLTQSSARHVHTHRGWASHEWETWWEDNGHMLEYNAHIMGFNEPTIGNQGVSHRICAEH